MTKSHKGRCYAPKRCRACEAAESKRNVECLHIVKDLRALECGEPFTAADAENVIAVLRHHGATLGHFQTLDEKPGYFPGYCDGTAEWHWKLRRTRNQHGTLLFAALRKEAA